MPFSSGTVAAIVGMVVCALAAPHVLRYHPAATHARPADLIRAHAGDAGLDLTVLVTGANAG